MYIRKDQPLGLRIAIVILCGLLVAGGAYEFWRWQEYRADWLGMVLAVLQWVTAYGLLRRRNWARRIASGLLWIVVVLVPLGTLNPFHASDLMAAGEQPPSVTELLLWLGPMIGAALWLLHLLGKYKAHFGVIGETP